MFTKAEKKKQKLRLALTGPSGSGKTYSALTMAFGIFGKDAKVCVIDTEHGSAELYSDKFPEYYVSQFSPPYAPEAYIKRIKEAEAFGADVIIIDSISHEWNGQGGCLEMVDVATNSSNSKNSYTSWKNVTPKHQAFIDAILASKAHIIATMRAKQEYALVEKNGKKMPEKIGLAPIQREGMDYEFTLVFDLPGGGNFMASSSKDRTGFFSGKVFPIDETLCSAILNWLNSGQEPDKKSLPPELIAQKMVEKLRLIESEKDLNDSMEKIEEKYKDNAVIMGIINPVYFEMANKLGKPFEKKDTSDSPISTDEVPWG